MFYLKIVTHKKIVTESIEQIYDVSWSIGYESRLWKKEDCISGITNQIERSPKSYSVIEYTYIDIVIYKSRKKKK